MRRALATEDEHDAVVDRAAAVFISDVARRREGQCETGGQLFGYRLPKKLPAIGPSVQSINSRTYMGILNWRLALSLFKQLKREAEAIRSRSKRRSSHKEGAPSGSGSPGTSNRPFVVFEASPSCTRSRERRVRRPPRSPTARVPGDAIIDTLTASRERRTRRPRRRARDGTATPFPMGP